MGVISVMGALFGCSRDLPDQAEWEAEVRAAAREVAGDDVDVQWATRGGLGETRQMEITTQIDGTRADAERTAAEIEEAVAPVAVRIPTRGAVYITVDARPDPGAEPYRHWQQETFDQLAKKYRLPREK